MIKRFRHALVVALLVVASFAGSAAVTALATSGCSSTAHATECCDPNPFLYVEFTPVANANMPVPSGKVACWWSATRNEPVCTDNTGASPQHFLMTKLMGSLDPPQR